MGYSRPEAYVGASFVKDIMLMRTRILLAALAALATLPSGAHALDRDLGVAFPLQGEEEAAFDVAFDVAWAKQDRARDHDRAYDATKSGRSMPLPMIERRVVPKMGDAQYLGPEFRGSIYRLKFLSNGRVIWVDVDARTGNVVRRSGK